MDPLIRLIQAVFSWPAFAIILLILLRKELAELLSAVCRALDRTQKIDTKLGVLDLAACNQQAVSNSVPTQPASVAMAKPDGVPLLPRPALGVLTSPIAATGGENKSWSITPPTSIPDGANR